MKYAVIIIVLIVLLGGGLFWWHQHTLAAEEAAASAIQTAKVTYNDIKVSVQSTGAVSSNRDVDIKCKASGNITILPYTDIAAKVEPNALLLQLDTTDEQRSLDSANAVVAADQARLKEAQLNWQISKMNLVTTKQKDDADLQLAKAELVDASAKLERTQALYQSKLESKEDVETAETTQATADSALKTAAAAIEELKQTEITIDTKEQEIAEMKAQLDQDFSKAQSAQQDMDYCTVNAPTDQISDWWPIHSNDPPKWVISKMTVGVAVGYLVQSGSSGASGGTTVMTLSDMSHVFILATVAESDIGNLFEKFDAGQELPVSITADAYQNVVFSGKVVRIAPIGTNTSNVVTFEVKIEVTSANRSLLRPVMTANVDIISAQRKHVLSIPVQAFIHKKSESESDSQPATDAASVTADSAVSDGASPPAATRAGKKKNKGLMPKNDEAPVAGTVTVIRPDGSQETRDVVVGLSDDTSYEVISGLSVDETVLLNKTGADSRWHGGGRNGPGGGMRGGGGIGR